MTPSRPSESAALILSLSMRLIAMLEHSKRQKNVDVLLQMGYQVEIVAVQLANLSGVSGTREQKIAWGGRYCQVELPIYMTTSREDLIGKSGSFDASDSMPPEDGEIPF